MQRQASSTSPTVSLDSHGAGVPMNEDQQPLVTDEDLLSAPTDGIDCSAAVVEEIPSDVLGEETSSEVTPNLPNEEVALLHARIKELERDVEGERQRNGLRALS